MKGTRNSYWSSREALNIAGRTFLSLKILREFRTKSRARLVQMERPAGGGWNPGMISAFKGHTRKGSESPPKITFNSG